MINVGITGQSGFIGSHLYNYLGLKKDIFIRVEFQDNYFDDAEKLNTFVQNCDVIVHLAAMNRHNEPSVIYSKNIQLVEQLIAATENIKHFPRILFSSSIQEEKENEYGRSKLYGRKLLEAWAERNDAEFIGLIIPNVFGPFGNPYYNSVIATFSYQLTHGEMLKIEIDGKLKLIYVQTLVETFERFITATNTELSVQVEPEKEIFVSEIYSLLLKFKKDYLDKNIIPELKDKFDLNLFNTFRSYIDLKHYPVAIQKRADERGYLIETVQENTGGQVFFSVTKPGITRGNHFHIRKIERFCVVKGVSSIKLRKVGTETIQEFIVAGIEPCIIDIPVWFTHNITNIGDSDLLTLFWCNEIFNPEDPDTYYEEVECKKVS